MTDKGVRHHNAGMLPDGGTAQVKELEGASFELVIKEPKTMAEAENLADATAVFMIKAVRVLAETGFGCHAGCTFSRIMDRMFERFCDDDPAEFAKMMKRRMQRLREHLEWHDDSDPDAGKVH